jgi:hypothetical protein
VPDPDEPALEEAEEPAREGPKPPASSDASAEFPDPGIAPVNGNQILVLSGTTLGLTAVGTATGIVVGLQRQIELEWLLPSTLVPAVALLAFSGGGLYLGIKRKIAYRRWEIGNRVVGLPQGGGLIVGGTFCLLAALSFVPGGISTLTQGESAAGATMLAVGGTALVAAPIMYVTGTRHRRRWQHSGGWVRRAIPPRPPAPTSHLEMLPILTPIPRGVSLGVAGRF